MQRQLHKESAPMALALGVQADPSIMKLNNLAAYPESKTTTTSSLLRIRVKLYDFIEDLTLIGRRDPKPCVLNLQKQSQKVYGGLISQEGSDSSTSMRTMQLTSDCAFFTYVRATVTVP